MTPTEKHLEDGLMLWIECLRDGTPDAGNIIATALANSEREGMKRAAEIAKAHYDARHAALARAHGMNIATAILSQAGEGE